MKDLEKMVLSDDEVMDVKAMKAIVGGQVSQNLCRNTGSGSGVGSSSNVVCSGECPTVQPGASGSTGPVVKKTCKTDTFGSSGHFVTSCACK